MIEFRTAWTRFDKSTAYGCASRKLEYDPELCNMMWKEYCNIFIKYDVVPPIII